MAKENFSELSTEELIKKKKTMTFTIGLVVGILTILSIIISQNDIGVTPLLIVVVLVNLPVLIWCNSQVNSMNKELKSRKSN